jgi:hypothetical protein
MRRIGSCERCGRRAEMSSHHPMPRRHYGKGKQNPITFELCDICHALADKVCDDIDKRLFESAKKIYLEEFRHFMGKIKPHG